MSFAWHKFNLRKPLIDHISLKLKKMIYVCTRILRGGAEVARWAHNPKVAGSSPAPATINSRDSSLGSYPPWGGHRFESCPR